MIWGYHNFRKHPYRQNFVESRLTIGWIRIHEAGNVTSSFSKAKSKIEETFSQNLTKLVEHLHDFCHPETIMIPGNTMFCFFLRFWTLGSDHHLHSPKPLRETATPRKINGWNPSKSKQIENENPPFSGSVDANYPWTVSPTAVCWFSRPMSFNLWRATGTREDPLEKKQEMTAAIGPLVTMSDGCHWSIGLKKWLSL